MYVARSRATHTLRPNGVRLCSVFPGSPTRAWLSDVGIANGPSLWQRGERSCGEQANQRAGDPAGFCWLLAAQDLRASVQVMRAVRLHFL
jgi:hypothetical protein